MSTDWWSAEVFESSEAEPLPVNQVCAGRVPTLIPSCNATICALKQSAGTAGSGKCQEGRYAPAYI